MDDRLQLWEKPSAEKNYMIAGWQQWADAGSISSGLPEYLIDITGARKIGEIESDDFYLFQVPGTHHFLRPEVKLEEGYRVALESPRNEFYYAQVGDKGLYIFLGEEPHLRVGRYAGVLLDAVRELGVSRVAALGGVYGAMPYDKDREVSCVYSLPGMKEELAQYAVRFSNYEGGVTIGTYLVDQAEERDIELIDFYVFVPAYDFSELSETLQGVRIETDYKAWYDLTRRFNHMFDLGIDLSDLARQADEITASMDAEINQLEEKMPELHVRDYMQKVAKNFTEISFMPLDDVWERELGDLFGDSKDQ
jgi:predicted ATP-grasp superfamily ATP-dependent carboligase